MREGITPIWVLGELWVCVWVSSLTHQKWPFLSDNLADIDAPADAGGAQATMWGPMGTLGRVRAQNSPLHDYTPQLST